LPVSIAILGWVEAGFQEGRGDREPTVCRVRERPEGNVEAEALCFREASRLTSRSCRRQAA